MTININVYYVYSGFELNTRHVRDVTVPRNMTHREFYAYRLAVLDRNDGFSLLHSGCKLFLQYILDAYVTVEGNRLNYLRENQRNLRAETLQGLEDYVHELEADANDSAPRRTRPRRRQTAAARPNSSNQQQANQSDCKYRRT